MKRVMATMAIGLSVVSMANAPAWAQTAKDFVGTWQMAANVNTASDGTKSEPFGASPRGMTIFSADGHFVQVLTRPDLPKFASGNRLRGTAEENQAIVHGSVGYFGTYSVSGKILTLHMQGGTWPGWTGTDQVRNITAFNKDSYTVSLTAAQGGTSVVTWKRVK